MNILLINKARRIFAVFFTLLSLLLTSLLLTSCNSEGEVFTESSAQRATTAIKEYTKILTQQENGWILKYYPQSAMEYGGYTTLIKFASDGKVQMASELFKSTDVLESSYSLKQSAGIYLTFDTYNEMIHLFSDPSAPFRGSTGSGMEGDYDFSIMHASQDSIVLKGRKSGTRAVMVPMKIDKQWKEYIEETNAAEFMMTFKKYTLDVSGKTYKVSRTDRNLTISADEEETQSSIVAHYLFTPKGIELYEPIEIDGKKISGFVLTDNDVYPEVNNTEIVLMPEIPNLNEYLVDGMWFISYSNLGVYGQKYWNYLKTSLDNINEELLFAFIGTYNGQFSFTFNSSGYIGSLYYDYFFIGSNQISLNFPLMADTNGANYYNNVAGMKSALVPFAHSSTRFFNLSADDVKRPTWIKLTDKYEKTNIIVLTKSIVTYPFKN
ncbi:MAG: hypothetical protein H6Q20_2243 [Bacteroidetes bacterium]|nr:hypothetical protein [Bacteroidota bacterium]MBP1677684.1 hypothetical protein [Bacteroidota bacterium]